MNGKKPTVAEQRRFDSIHERGCVPCWLEAKLQSRKWIPEPCEIHHVDQSSHDQTYGNCPWHHRGIRKNDFDMVEMRNNFGPSMAREPEKYRARYGSETDLLVLQRSLLLKSPHTDG